MGKEEAHVMIWGVILVVWGVLDWPDGKWLYSGFTEEKSIQGELLFFPLGGEVGIRSLLLDFPV